jgi:hypothetical protein
LIYLVFAAEHRVTNKFIGLQLDVKRIFPMGFIRRQETVPEKRGADMITTTHNTILKRLARAVAPWFGMALVAVLLSDCATIINGKHQTLTFNSVPDGADVRVAGKVLGKTPLTISLEKQTGLTATFEKEGYKPASVNLNTSIDPWFWGNVIVGGVLGSTTDAAAGTVNKYSQDQYVATLEKTVANRVDGRTSISLRDRVREFIMLSYAELEIEMSRGSGAHLTGLFELLNVEKGSEPYALIKLRAMAATYPEAWQFAQNAVDAFSI